METLFVGKTAVFLPETESTNSYAINLLKNVNPAEGTIVHTAHQTSGKGQRGSAWISDPESNLAVSVVLKPAFLSASKQFYLYIMAALACHDTIAQILDSSHFDIRIKWPNDILVNAKKVAGILIENNFVGAELNWSVIGTGININQQRFTDLPNATSLALLTRKGHAVANVLGLLCRHTEKHYMALKSGKLKALLETYMQRLYGRDQWLLFEVKGAEQRLKVTGLSEEGLLQLQGENGEQFNADVKDVKWRF